MVKRAFEEEHDQPPQQTATVSTTRNKRKRVEHVQPRQAGRPTREETLIRIGDEQNNMEALQLSSRELILPGSGDENKKSRTILTKCKQNIVVETHKQYLTYDLFADNRKKALETIREQRDTLSKISTN
ncbi:Hypothetical predicted protein [Paramuricea clavata]|uniref:Uncharacterized protein n=1 Tax=Paramuricea clavata TaxID=317549 RepID=A0A7D9IHS7_PARCT|nr:Hypothetical predicted protein [Paramuricea clavata]